MKTFLVGVAALLLAGCGGVVSEHPASDEAATRVDDRLIGFWRVDWEASRGDKDDGPRHEWLFVVGRRAGPEAGLELLSVSLEKGEVLKAEREPIRPTTIAGKPYLSLHVTGEARPPKDAWSVLRYDVPEEGTLRVLAMDPAGVAKDVREGRIAGSAPTPGPGAAEDSVLVTLTATTSVLRAYLEQRGDAVFRSEHPLVLRRLNLR